MSVQSRREINPGVDRRFWALDHEQSMHVLGLYDEGRALMASYLRKEEEIKKNTKILFSELLKDIDSKHSDRTYKAIPNKSDGSPPMTREGQQTMSERFMHTRLENELRTIYNQLDNVATRCSEIQLCPALAQLILSRLPRELRDYIYDLLWSIDDIKLLDRVMSTVPTHIQYRDQHARRLPDLPAPIFANPRLLGTEFATEFALRYIRAFSAAEIDYRCVRAYLNYHRFGSLYFPLKRVIKSLTITLGDNVSLFVEYFAETAWRDSLDSLLTLKDQPGVKIIIYVPTWMQYRKRFFEVLEITRAFFYKFRESSMDVKILGYDFFNPIEDDTEGIFSEQLNHYFDRTPEEWLDMKAKEIKEIRDAKQRKACKGILRAMRMNLDFYNEEIRHNEATQTA